ncbi:hypothetical protein [Denitratisoma oestradiolicum]|nr:hypothetical protein [Denitratisoma oestradiolicum]
MVDELAPDDATERRRDSQLRGIFVEAYDVLEPFFDPANNWAGHSHEHLAFRALHERFPSLSQEQVFVIVTAAKRVFSSGGAPSS